MTKAPRGEIPETNGGKTSNFSVVEQEFDAKAATYETYRLAPWYQAHADEILKFIDPSQDGTLVDVGCGTGWFLRQVTAKCPGLRGVGIDLSGKMIDTARMKSAAAGGAELTFVKADWETEAETEAETVRTALAGRDVKVVVCANAFHYFADPQEATRRFHEALAPGGRFLLLERAKNRSVLTLFWDLLHRFVIKDDVQFYNTAELMEILRKAGFRNIEVVTAIRKLLWKGKTFTSVVLISADKG